MASRWDIAYVFSEANQIDVTVGVATANVAIPADTAYLTADLLDYIGSEIKDQIAETFVLAFDDDNERVTIVHSLGSSFDWDWTGGAIVATDVRDHLGYTANVVGQTALWTATNAPDRVFWLASRPQSGVDSDGYQLDMTSSGAVTIDSTWDASSVTSSALPARTIGVNLQRDGSGEWGEITQWHDFLSWVGGGSLLRIYPDTSDDSERVDGRFAGPGEMVLRRRFPRNYRYWQTEFDLVEVE